MNLLMYRSLACTLLLLSSPVFALEIGEPINSTIAITPPTSNIQAAGISRQAQTMTKEIVIMGINLSPKEKEVLQAATEGIKDEAANNFSEAPMTASSLPHQASVNLNNTPVLDQGAHGTCTTFANTAAIDILLGKGDYVSQLCNLALGSYFEQKGYYDSGWNGAFGPDVLNQIMNFGIIPKTTQKQKTCGGLKDYPTRISSERGKPMHLDEFNQSSQNIGNTIKWIPLLTTGQDFEWGTERPAKMDALLDEVKKTIASNNHDEEGIVTIGSLLPVGHCSNGACARYHTPDDTWALTSAIIKDHNPFSFGGHAMVVIGYNDFAVAVDNEGKKHRGLLTLRNSWGTGAGDFGNYYMTYDFFKVYVMEVQKIKRK